MESIIERAVEQIPNVAVMAAFALIVIKSFIDYLDKTEDRHKEKDDKFFEIMDQYGNEIMSKLDRIHDSIDRRGGKRSL